MNELTSNLYTSTKYVIIKRLNTCNVKKLLRLNRSYVLSKMSENNNSNNPYLSAFKK